MGLQTAALVFIYHDVNEDVGASEDNVPVMNENDNNDDKNNNMEIMREVEL